MNEKLTRDGLKAFLEAAQSELEWQQELLDTLIEAVEEKSDAEEYRTPKKAIYNEDETWYQCPTCRCVYEDVECPEDSLQYCPNCGQALDWTEVKE